MNNNTLLYFIKNRFYMFLKGEFIKRNFEYTSHDSDWLINNWDYPIKLKKFPIDYAILFLDDLIAYYHHKQYNLAYQSILVEPNEKEYQYIIKYESEWIKKVYEISIEYGLSFAELVHPYSMEYILEKNIPYEKLPIPTFIEYFKNDGFLGVFKAPNCLGQCLIVIDFNNAQFSFDSVIESIKQAISIEANYYFTDLSESIKYTLDGIIDKDTKKIKNENSDRARLFGLAQWDHRVKYAEFRDNKITEFKKKLRSLGWTYCESGSDCPCPMSACSAALTAQRYATVNSIKLKQICEIKNRALALPEEARYKFTRIDIPDPDTSFENFIKQ